MSVIFPGKMVSRFWTVSLYWVFRPGRRKRNLWCGISLPYVDYFRNISSATVKSIICSLDLYSTFGQSTSIGLTKLLSWNHKICCCLWEGCSAWPVRHCHRRFQHLLLKTWIGRRYYGGRLWRELWSQVVSAVKINPQDPQAVPQDRLAAWMGDDWTAQSPDRSVSYSLLRPYLG